MSIRDRDYRPGKRVPGSGTTGIPIYACETCRDAGVVTTRECPLEDAVLTGSSLFTRQYVTRPCPDCDGVPRLAGEPAPELNRAQAHIDNLNNERTPQS